MKKCIIIFLLFMSFVSMATNFTIDSIKYQTLSNGENPTVFVGPSTKTGNVIIPETVYFNDTTYTITEIGEYAFYQNTALTSISIPNTITKIGYHAFAYCSGLTSIEI